MWMKHYHLRLAKFGDKSSVERLIFFSHIFNMSEKLEKRNYELDSIDVHLNRIKDTKHILTSPMSTQRHHPAIRKLAMTHTLFFEKILESRCVK